MKYLLICNASQNVITFRRSLILMLLNEKNEVAVVASDEEYRKEIEELGVKFYICNANNRSVNIFKAFSYKRSIRKVIEKEQPDIVFTFQAKPNTFGVFAAKKEKVSKIFAMVEGAGDVFINTGFKWKIIRKITCFLYRKSFKYCKKIFFLNEDDKSEFIRRKLVREDQTLVIHGVGVDLEYFSYKPVKNYRTFLMVARMLKTKGVYEYCKCARIVKQKYPDAVFNYIGVEGTVKLADIQEYIEDGSIHYLGTTKDVRPYYVDSFVLVLPSYREGFGLAIAEAGAIGRMSIASDVEGVREAIADNYSGFLVEQKNSKKVSEKVIWCIEHPQETEEMGRNARKYAEKNFDQKIINQQIMDGILEGLDNER